jgi:hypothetical protein
VHFLSWFRVLPASGNEDSLTHFEKGSLAFFLLVTIRTFFFEELEAGRDMFNLLMEQYPYVAGLLPYLGLLVGHSNCGGYCNATVTRRCSSM